MLGKMFLHLSYPFDYCLFVSETNWIGLVLFFRIIPEKFVFKFFEVVSLFNYQGSQLLTLFRVSKNYLTKDICYCQHFFSYFFVFFLDGKKITVFRRLNIIIFPKSATYIACFSETVTLLCKARTALSGSWKRRFLTSLYWANFKISWKLSASSGT